MRTVRLIDFSDMAGMQDRTVAFAVNNNKPWTNEDYAYLAANMFDQSIEQLAKHLGRTASAVWTVFTKDEDFLNIREANGAVIRERNVGPRDSEKPEEGNRDNRIITSDANILFNFGD